MKNLERLQNWYRAQCNNDWEHSYGVKIDTLDNPGWALSIDLRETSLENKPFKTFAFGVGKDAATSGDEWLMCKVEDQQFIARGGPHKLDAMIQRFLDWAEAAS